MAAAIGFNVQVAQSIGAGAFCEARNTMKQAFCVTLIFCVPLVLVGVAVSGYLPHWLGGAQEICGGASRYFLIYVLFVPVTQMLHASSQRQHADSQHIAGDHVRAGRGV